ncbi:extracellular solute-binding protein [Galbitalea sp. SE-J8]|nr:extracellular solute-binding protein [Galbitalea sp. SE-J8]
MLRKFLATATAAVVLAVGLSGCSAAGANDDKTLVFWTVTQGDEQLPVLEDMIQRFEDAHPGVTVDLEQRSIDAHKDALRQVAGTGVGPDVYFYWEGSGLAGELVDAGLSADLTSYYNKYDWDDRFTSAALAGITQYGGHHGVPWTRQAMAVYYNKTLFKKAGIATEPTTYDELIADADALVDAGVTPIEVGGTVNWHIMRLLDSLVETECGATTATALFSGSASWADETCVTASYEQLKTWGDKYFNDGYLSMSNDDSSLLFFSGDAAMAIEGTWFDGTVVENGMDPNELGIFRFPTGTGRLSGFGEALYVNDASTKKDLAATFLDFVTSTPIQKDSVGTWASLSANKEVAAGTDNPLDALWEPFFTEADGVYNPADQSLSGEVTTEYWRIQNAVLTGEIAPADAGAQLQTFIDGSAK